MQDHLVYCGDDVCDIFVAFSHFSGSVSLRRRRGVFTKDSLKNAAQSKPRDVLASHPRLL